MWFLKKRLIGGGVPHGEVKPYLDYSMKYLEIGYILIFPRNYQHDLYPIDGPYNA